MKKNIVKTKVPNYNFGGMVQMIPQLMNILEDVSKKTKNNEIDPIRQPSNNGINIESPQEALVKNDIAKANADMTASNNGWVRGLEIGGGVAQQLGSMLMSYGSGASSTSTLGGNAVSTTGSAGFMNKNFGTMAMGGEVPLAPVEVEGQEVGETPNGQLLDFQGPSHENGGIPISLPPGTEIYSKRIKVDGVSMADRKKKRERKTVTLESLFEKNKTDALIKNSLQRTQENNQIEEDSDNKIQMVVKQLLDKQENPNLEKHKYGTNVGGEPIDELLQLIMGGGNDDLINKYGKKSQPSMPTPGINPTSQNPNIDFNKINEVLSGMKMSDNASMDGIGITDKEGSFADYTNKLNKEYTPSTTSTSKDSAEGSEGFKMSNLLGGMTLGDALGMAGNWYQADKIMDTIKANRAGDTPNINAFKDYGKKGLETLDKTKQYVNQVRDEKLKDLELSRTGSIKRNSNSARSVNTVRALNLATDAGINNTKEETFNSFAEQMMSILGQQAGMENQQDQVVMGGEDVRDDRDRQDRDNYFSQLITGYKNKGQVISETGRNLNQIKSNDVGLKAVNNMTNYVQDDGNGNISLKPGVTIVGSSVQKDGKEIAKLSDKEVLELYKKGLLTQKGT